MHKQKTSHQQDRCEASSRDNVMKLLCIHQNLLNLNYWSGPSFPLHFRSGRGRSKNSPLVSVPRSLSMFPESGSISKFRWASCSPSSWCAWAHTIALLCRKAYTPTVHVNIYTLPHGPHKTAFPRSFSAVSVSEKAQPLLWSHSVDIHTTVSTFVTPSSSRFVPLLLSSANDYFSFWEITEKSTCSSDEGFVYPLRAKV